MGQDKGFLLYKNKPFVNHSIDALLPLTQEIFIVSDHKKYDSLGYKRIEDVIKDAGPLSGIVSGLRVANNRYCLVVSCDVPLLTTQVLRLLIDAITKEETVIMLKTQTHQMPLLALYPVSCLPVLEKSLFSGNRKVKIALKNCKVKYVMVDSCFEKNIQNINTPEEFEHINNKTNF